MKGWRWWFTQDEPEGHSSRLAGDRSMVELGVAALAGSVVAFGLAVWWLASRFLLHSMQCGVTLMGWLPREQR